MANLIEAATFEPNVFQLETTTQVLGGPGGVSNLQAQQLANRTKYLKQFVDALDGDLDAHIAAGDPHTQYAPKASPALTGTPTAPTAAGGTNSTQLSTTAFVQAAITALIAGAPVNLNTLDELAASIGDDANFAATMSAALAAKAALNTAQTFTKAQRGAIVTQTYAALMNPDFALANYFNLVLGGNGTLGLPANLVPGQSGLIWIQQDGAGNRSLAYSTEWCFVDKVVPQPTPTPNAIDCLAFAVKAANHISCVYLTDIGR